MEGKETGQCRLTDSETTSKSTDELLTDGGEDGEKVCNNGCTSEAHLPPRQDITHEGGRHHQKEDDDTKGPYKKVLHRIQPIVDTTSYMDIDDKEEEGCTIGVHITKESTAINIPHDMLDQVKGTLSQRGVMEGQDYTCKEL